MRYYIKPKVVKDKSDWHVWFAWHPVWAENSKGDTVIVWLEKVYRKITKETSYSLEWVWDDLEEVPYTYNVYEYGID